MKLINNIYLRLTFLSLIILISIPAYAAYSVVILNAATTTGAGSSYQPGESTPRTYQCRVSGTGSVSATVYIEVSNDDTSWATSTNSLITFTLSGTTSDTGFAAVQAAKWPYIRANVSAISGTSAVVTCTVGG